MAAVLALTASGCVTVHGELEVVPAATKAEAAKALAAFTDAYNAADKAFDPALDAGRVTGALGAINQAGLKSRSITSPGGNPAHRPLRLTDARYVIPKKAGWPRWFVADTDSNRDTDRGADDERWVLVFVRNGPEQLWEVAYLQILAAGGVPEFATDQDGWARPVEPDSAALAVAPKNLSEEYTSYLHTGKPEHFAAGPHTTVWREERARVAKRPGLATQYVDQPLDTGDYAPLGLATRDGGALVFFATRFYDRQVAAKGYRPKVSPEVRALMTGEVRSTLTKEWVSSQAVLVKPAGAAADQVTVLGRLQGVTSATGS
ncbi:putative lipoprotein [Streptomyces lavendofoliae]|uniref:Lipoprotein n=2 Tax=Streptomyces lavendofoliae TaxID=67314 RepID=A0A918M2F3_9ACTN|nr:putative lipoprotein [Streptomyces lavendofoliae]